MALEMPGDSKPIPVRILGQAGSGVLDPKLRAFVFRFEVDNADGRLLVGQAGTAIAYLRESATVPVVPAAAILTDAGRPFLFVQVGGESFERRNVELGREGRRPRRGRRPV